MFSSILCVLNYVFGSCNRWKALDFAALKRSSVSFFDIEKPETAVSRWSRARTRAAKVVSSIMFCVSLKRGFEKKSSGLKRNDCVM